VLAFARSSPKRPGIRDFGYPIPIVLLSYDDYRRMDADGHEYQVAHPKPYTPPTRGFWTELKLKYPTAWGLITLSKVGFNPQHTEALVQARTSCGDECYADEIVFLEQTNRRWRVVERIPNDVGSAFPHDILRYVGPKGRYPSESELLPVPSPSVPSEADARAGVYRAVLDSLYSFDGERPRTIVIADALRGDDPQLRPHRSVIDPELLQRYAFLSAIRAPLNLHLQYPIPVVILPEDSVAVLNAAVISPYTSELTKEFWSAFKNRYPGAWGMVGFRRIAFDSTRSKALVYTIHSCGEYCENADTWFLDRSGSNWRIVERIPRTSNDDLSRLRLRYLGADARLDTYRPRRVRGVISSAKTHRPIPYWSVKVLINSVSNDTASTNKVIKTDAVGHYALTSLPLAGAITMRVDCPPKSDHDAVQLDPIYFRPGTDTTVNLAVSFISCIDPPTPPPPPNILEGATATIGADEARFVFPLQNETNYVWDTPPKKPHGEAHGYDWSVSWEVPGSLDGKAAEILWLLKPWKAGGPRNGSLSQLIAGDTLWAMINCTTCDGAVFGDPEMDHTKVFATVENGQLVFIVHGADAVRHVFPVIPKSVTFRASVREIPWDYGPGYETQSIHVPVTLVPPSAKP
jgi:hypothetical protein